MNSAGGSSGETNAELAGEFGVAGGSHRSGLFVAHVNVSYTAAVSAKSLDEAVDAIARQPENDVHVPIQQALNENVRSSHNGTPASRLRRVYLCFSTRLRVGTKRQACEVEPGSTLLRAHPDGLCLNRSAILPDVKRLIHPAMDFCFYIAVQPQRQFAVA